jgi:hypothetical protein
MLNHRHHFARSECRQKQLRKSISDLGACDDLDGNGIARVRRTPRVGRPPFCPDSGNGTVVAVSGLDVSEWGRYIKVGVRRVLNQLGSGRMEAPVERIRGRRGPPSP